MMNHTMRKRMLAAVLSALMVLSLTACGPKKQPGQNDTSGAVSTVDAMETLTMDRFKGYDLTLVNLFTTWCTPCVREIPELNQLRKNMADKNVNVIGVCLDAVDPYGKVISENVATAMELKSRTGAEYTFYQPDFSLFGGRMMQVTAVPETFFVDREGNVVGMTWMGARDLAGWTKVVEGTLAALEA